MVFLGPCRTTLSLDQLSYDTFLVGLFFNVYVYHIVACQGGGVSSKTRRADKTWSLNP